MNNLTFSDLTFPMLEYAKNETPWDLAPLLYSGGAKCRCQHRTDPRAGARLPHPKQQKSSVGNGSRGIRLGQ